VLDSFLSAAYTQDKKTKEKRAFVETLKKLPKEELFKIASGELKVADLCPMGSTDEGWLGRFKGTPLFAQALMLEQQALQLDAEDISRRSQQRNDDIWLQRDQIQLQKRLLELQLIQATAQAGAVAPGPISPEAGTQGAGALGPEAAGITDGGIQDRPDSTGVKTSADFEAMKTLMSMAKLALDLAHADAERLKNAASGEERLDSEYARLKRNKLTPAQKLRHGFSALGGLATGAGIGGGIGYGAGHAARLLGANANPASIARAGALIGGAGGGVLGTLIGDTHGITDVRRGKIIERIANLEEKADSEKTAFSLPPGLAGQLGGAASRVMGKLGPQGTKALIGAGVGAVGGGLLGAHEGGARGAIGGALGGAALGGAAGHVGGNVAASMAKGVPLGRALQVGAARSGGQLLGAGRQAVTEGRQLLGGLSGPKAPVA